MGDYDMSMTSPLGTGLRRNGEPVHTYHSLSRAWVSDCCTGCWVEQNIHLTWPWAERRRRHIRSLRNKHKGINSMRRRHGELLSQRLDQRQRRWAGGLA